MSHVWNIGDDIDSEEDILPEPEYVDPDDPYGDDSAKRMKDSLTPKEESLAKRALHACGKKRFASVDEKKKWNRSYTPGNSEDARIQKLWVIEKIEWAESMNSKIVNGQRKIVIVFPALLSAINNISAKTNNLPRLRKLLADQDNKDIESFKKEYGL